MDREFRKLANAPAWASQAPATDTLDPASASPPIVRTNGLGTAYSLPDGTQIEYNVMNQLLLELSSAAKEIVNGVSEWHVSVAYRIGSVTKRRGQLFVCLQDNTGFQPGSAHTHWRPIGQITGVAPDPPIDPAWSNALALSLTLDWRNGEDNGGLITYRLRWRKIGSTSYSAWETLSYARRVWTNLEAGDRLDVQVQSNNGIDWSPSMSTTTPPALAVRTTAPAGGPAIGLLAKAGDKQATLTWTTPDNNGGSPITAYIVQWKTPTGSYSNANQAILGVVNTYIVPKLTNGTTYTFRVAARNAIGTGDWSNESDALPSGTPTTIGNFGRIDGPTLVRYRPAPPATPQNRIYGNTNIVPDPNAPTLNIQTIEWNFRNDNQRAWGVQTTSPSNQLALIDVASGWWNIRYRARTPTAVSAWSPLGRIEVGTTPPPPPKIRLTYNKTTNRLIAWPELVGDGGFRARRLDLRFEYTIQRPGEEEIVRFSSEAVFIFSAQRPRPASYDIAFLNRWIRGFSNTGNNHGLTRPWYSAYRGRNSPNAKVSVWIAASSNLGQGKWVESNVLAWEDYD